MNECSESAANSRLLAAALQGLFRCNAVLLGATVVRLLTFALTLDLGWGSVAVYGWEVLSFAAVVVQYPYVRRLTGTAGPGPGRHRSAPAARWLAIFCVACPLAAGAALWRNLLQPQEHAVAYWAEFCAAGAAHTALFLYFLQLTQAVRAVARTLSLSSAEDDAMYVLALLWVTAGSFVLLAVMRMQLAPEVSRPVPARPAAWSPRLLTLLVAAYALLHLVRLLKETAAHAAGTASGHP